MRVTEPQVCGHREPLTHQKLLSLSTETKGRLLAHFSRLGVSVTSLWQLPGTPASTQLLSLSLPSEPPLHVPSNFLLAPPTAPPARSPPAAAPLAALPESSPALVPVTASPALPTPVSVSFDVLPLTSPAPTPALPSLSVSLPSPISPSAHTHPHSAPVPSFPSSNPMHELCQAAEEENLGALFENGRSVRVVDCDESRSRGAMQREAQHEAREGATPRYKYRPRHTLRASSGVALVLYPTTPSLSVKTTISHNIILRSRVMMISISNVQSVRHD